jgi:hypothetical protein
LQECKWKKNQALQPLDKGKNFIIISNNKKYLILVPRIILMDQLKEEIIKHKPNLKNKIQLIGDSNNEFNENKLITICVFNSVSIVEKYCDTFEKIYIDEAHHINKPLIYCDDEEYDNITEDINDSGDKSEYDSDEESVISKDDSEDELVNVKNYTKII